MPISVPRNVGQLPVHYNKKGTQDHSYVEELATPLYPFGYGKSFSNYEYKDLKIVKNQDSTSFLISFQLSNTGKYDGDEVAQLYLKNQYASVSQPLKQLKKFERVHLKSGESKTMEFKLSKSELSVLNIEMKKVFEPGSEFTILIGGSSNEIKLQDQLVW